MTDVGTELLEKFHQFCRAGKNARLSLECHGGQAWANLHVQLQLPPHHAAPAQYQRRPGPSRLRRRARRAAARKLAAEEAAQNTDYTEKVDTVQSVDAAAEAATADLPPLQLAAEQAADQVVQQQHGEHQIPEEGVTLVTDVFCPDNEYQTAVQVEHARDQDLPPSTQQCHRHRQPQQEREKSSTGITLEDFQRLVKENSRKLNF